MAVQNLTPNKVLLVAFAKSHEKHNKLFFILSVYTMSFNEFSEL